MQVDLPVVPIVSKKQKEKKKIPWWKRALVFALGVFQICVGALIVFATSGAAAGFGKFMIQTGVNDCFNALCKPELLADLKQYYG